jgi:sugar phosphate isomerase/epimerase
MSNHLSRREFVKAGSLALAFSTAVGSKAIEPFNRPGQARLRLSLAAYSFRQFFQDGNNNRERAIPAGQEMDMFRFIDYCAEHGCAGAELTSYYFPKDVSNDYLRKVRRHAFLRGVEVSGTAVGNTFTHPPGEKRNQQIALVKQWIERAAILGAPHIRVFAGNAEGQPHQVARDHCIETLHECAEYAGEFGIFLGIENHGGIVAEPEALLDIVKAAQSPWVGINLDSGNFRTADPYKSLADCAPYAINVQLKTEIAPRGQSKQPTDLQRFIKILEEARYQGYLVLEYEASEDPFKAVPRTLQELHRLVA